MMGADHRRQSGLSGVDENDVVVGRRTREHAYDAWAVKIIQDRLRAALVDLSERKPPVSGPTAEHRLAEAFRTLAPRAKERQAPA
jgi:hypothetical protein